MDGKASPAVVIAAVSIRVKSNDVPSETHAIHAIA